MLEKNLTERVLLKASESGADFAEIFAEKLRYSSLTAGAGKIDGLSSGLRLGAGIRVFKGNFCGYAYTNDLSEEGLMKAAAAASAAIDGKKLIGSVNLVRQDIENKHKILVNPMSVPSKEKAALLKKFSDYGYAAAREVARVDVTQSSKIQEIFIANSDGLLAEDRRVRTRLGFSVKVEDGGRRFENFWTKGMLQGLEMIDETDLNEAAEETVHQAVEMLKADNCPAGKMPVVLAREIGGVLFHEACGHSLEATAVARNASVFCGRLGEQIASPLVTMVDDGTLPNQWGSTNIDDEGIPTRRNVLIEKGVLKGYLVDRFNGRRMQTEPTGIFAAQIRGGSVNTETGDFNFSVSRAYLIENGRITRPLRGAKLIGNGGEILRNIDMVGNNPGMRGGGQCGSKSGWVPVCHGTPTLRVAEIAVGGQK